MEGRGIIFQLKKKKKNNNPNNNETAKQDYCFQLQTYPGVWSAAASLQANLTLTEHKKPHSALPWHTSVNCVPPKYQGDIQVLQSQLQNAHK